MTPELLAMLTVEQRAAWESIQSEPLTFSESVHSSAATRIARSVLPDVLLELAEARAEVERLKDDAILLRVERDSNKSAVKSALRMVKFAREAGERKVEQVREALYDVVRHTMVWDLMKFADLPEERAVEILRLAGLGERVEGWETRGADRAGQPPEKKG